MLLEEINKIMCAFFDEAKFVFDAINYCQVFYYKSLHVHVKIKCLQFH